MVQTRAMHYNEASDYSDNLKALAELNEQLKNLSSSNAVPVGECIQPSASVRVNNVEVLPRSTPITQKLKVKPAGIDDFIQDCNSTKPNALF